jgi:hypothetical protein
MTDHPAAAHPDAMPHLLIANGNSLVPKPLEHVLEGLRVDDGGVSSAWAQTGRAGGRMGWNASRAGSAYPVLPVSDVVRPLLQQESLAPALPALDRLHSRKHFVCCMLSNPES